MSSVAVIDYGMGNLRSVAKALEHVGRANRAAARTKPLLGIWLGMQALLDRSDENGGADGLGIFAGQVRGFATPLHDPASGARLKVPHMGWNRVPHPRPPPLWDGLAQDSRFSFVH